MELVKAFFHMEGPTAAVICVTITCITICGTVTIFNILEHIRNKR